jgi:hypothetical protein
MGKKRKKMTPEERAEHEARYQETMKLLEERIAYHRAKLKEEHGPDYEPPTLEERIAYHEAKLKEERAKRRAS